MATVLSTQAATLTAAQESAWQKVLVFRDAVLQAVVVASRMRNGVIRLSRVVQCYLVLTSAI